MGYFYRVALEAIEGVREVFQYVYYFLIINKNVRYLVEEIICDRTTVFADSDILSIQVRPQSNSILVDMEVSTSPNSITREEIAGVRKLLINKLNKPVRLRVKMIPVNIVDLEN